MKLKTAFVITTEGGDWIPFEDFCRIRPTSHDGKRVHAIKFEDGTVWDACNGWREWTSTEKWSRFPDTIK